MCWILPIVPKECSVVWLVNGQMLRPNIIRPNIKCRGRSSRRPLECAAEDPPIQTLARESCVLGLQRGLILKPLQLPRTDLSPGEQQIYPLGLVLSRGERRSAPNLPIESETGPGTRNCGQRPNQDLNQRHSQGCVLANAILARILVVSNLCGQVAVLKLNRRVGDAPRCWFTSVAC